MAAQFHVLHDKRSLSLWNVEILRASIIEKLTERFGTLPTYGVLSGQAVASACFEVVGLGKAPMKDLDVFVDEKAIKAQEDAFLLNGYYYPFDCDTPAFYMCSYSDNLVIEALDKSAYQICYTSNLKENPDVNIIGCKVTGCLSPEVILSAFDLNICEIALDQVSGELYWTPAFEDFIWQKRIEVTRLITPIHTALRIVRKLEEMPQFSCNIDEQLNLIKKAQFIGVLCEKPEKQYLPSQLFSQYTVDKNRDHISKLKEHFQLQPITVTDTTMYKFNAINLSLKDQHHARHVLSMSNWTTEKNGYNSYIRAADALFKLERQHVSAASNAKYELLSSLIQRHDPSVSLSDNAFQDIFKLGCEENFSDIKKGLTALMLSYLTKHKHDLATVEVRDIKCLVRLLCCHHRLYQMYSGYDLRSFIVAAKNVRYMEKRKVYYAIGVYESGNEMEWEFPSLTCKRFKEKLPKAITNYREAAQQKRFMPFMENFESLITALEKHADVIEYKELTSQWAFIEVGQNERHCVGGYYATCARYDGIVLTLKHKFSGATSTAYYELYFKKDNEAGVLLNGRLRQHYARGNKPVSPELADLLPEHITVPYEKLKPDYKTVINYKDYDLIDTTCFEDEVIF